MKIQIEIDHEGSGMEMAIAHTLAMIPERDRASIVRVALYSGLQQILPSGTAPMPVQPGYVAVPDNILSEKNSSTTDGSTQRHAANMGHHAPMPTNGVRSPRPSTSAHNKGRPAEDSLYAARRIRQQFAKTNS